MADSIVPSILKSYNGKLIRINPNTGYICLTDMAKATEKHFKHWNELNSTSEYLNLFSSAVGIATATLLHVGEGTTGTWAHPKIAIRFAQWCSPEFAIQVDFWIDELLTNGKVEIEKDRQKLERNFLPTPALKQLKEMYGIKKMMHGKAYANRWMAQMEQRYYPALIGDAPAPEEMASLPTAKALLTPTEIAIELDWRCKSNPNAGDARRVNKLLEELGYQEKIAGAWSATAKAIDIKLCDRKPVETGSRTQKDQLLWSSDVLAILKEHTPAIQ